jgi:hypothetical protein
MIGGIPENHWRANRTYNSVVSRAVAIQAVQREWRISQTSGVLDTAYTGNDVERDRA